MDMLIGKTLGPYQIQQQVAQGRAATVYRAVDTRTGATVALKVFSPVLTADPAARQRFLREAQIGRQLHHPHIVPILDAGEQNGLPYLAGGSLRDRLDGSRMTVADVITFFRPVAAALDYAHGQGILHRDITPRNLLLSSEGVPFVSDFGIARVMGSTSLTSIGIILGTLEYLSPEQAHGRSLDHQSDQYSLGVVVYEALAGRPPFPSTGEPDQFAAVLDRICTEPPPPLRSLNPSIGPAVEAVLQRVLAKDAAGRYNNCQAFITALAQAYARDATAPTLVLQRPEPRHHWVFISGLAGLLGVLLIGMGFMLAVALMPPTRPDDPPPPPAQADEPAPPQRAAASLSDLPVAAPAPPVPPTPSPTARPGQSAAAPMCGPAPEEHFRPVRDRFWTPGPRDHWRSVHLWSDWSGEDRTEYKLLLAPGEEVVILGGGSVWSYLVGCERIVKREHAAVPLPPITLDQARAKKLTR